MTTFEQLVLSMRNAQKEYLHIRGHDMDRLELLKKLIRIEQAVDAHLAAASREPDTQEAKP